MKMVMISCNEAIDDEVTELLSSCGVDSFTKFRRALGKGKSSGSHLDSAIWPGANNVYLVVLEDKPAKALLEKVKQARNSLGKEGIKAFLLPVEDST